MRFWKPHENSITQYLHIFDMQWNQSCILKSASTLTTYSHAINTLFFLLPCIGYNFIVYDVKRGELRMGPSFTRVCLFCQTFFTWFVYKHTRYESDSFYFVASIIIITFCSLSELGLCYQYCERRR